MKRVLIGLVALFIWTGLAYADTVYNFGPNYNVTVPANCVAIDSTIIRCTENGYTVATIGWAPFVAVDSSLTQDALKKVADGKDAKREKKIIDSMKTRLIERMAFLNLKINEGPRAAVIYNGSLFMVAGMVSSTAENDDGIAYLLSLNQIWDGGASHEIGILADDIEGNHAALVDFLNRVVRNK